jgi:NADH:ubiquinone oxidoreductase subunit F (NADH-binding)
MLLDYFGEESDNCGVCDVCRKRIGEGQNVELDSIIEKIKEILLGKSVDAEELVQLSGFPEEDTINAIRHLLDNNKLIKGSDMKISWKN